MAWHDGTGPVSRPDGAGKTHEHDGVDPTRHPVDGTVPARRPWQVRVGVVTYAVWWAFVSVQLVRQGSYSAGAFTGAALWTLIVALALYRVWRGGPVARWFLHQFGVGVGAVLGLGIVLLFWVMSDHPDGVDWDFSKFAGPSVAVVLFGAGLLFGTAPARAWCPGSNPGRH